MMKIGQMKQVLGWANYMGYGNLPCTPAMFNVVLIAFKREMLKDSIIDDSDLPF